MREILFRGRGDTKYMGAMLKSMGLADDAVLSMSTSIVGLAGDMASFYNLDHETAFDKIHSGINDGTWYYGVPIRDFLAFLVNIEGCEVVGNVHDTPELLRGDNNA